MEIEMLVSALDISITPANYRTNYTDLKCIYNLRLNKERDVIHLISYGREFQLFGAITEKAD